MSNKAAKSETSIEAVEAFVESAAISVLAIAAISLVASDRRFRGGRIEPADLFQETAYKMIKNAKSFRQDSQISTWAYRILVNNANDSLRDLEKRKKDIEDPNLVFNVLAAPSENPLEAVIHQEVLGETLGPQSPMSMDERRALFLLIRGYSYEEMSEILQKPIGTLKAHVNRGRAKIKEKYDKIPKAA